MSQETKYSLTSEYLGCNTNNDQLQNSFATQHEQQSNRSNLSQVNLNQFDVQSLFGQTLNSEQLQHSNPLTQYQEQQQQQQSLNTMINEFSLMHDQQVDLLNQQRIRERLERRSGSVSTTREAFNLGRSFNSNPNCGRNIPSSSSPSSSTCFMTGNQVVLGMNSSAGTPVTLATTGQSPLAPSSHHTPPDSPITDLCHTLTPPNQNTMTLGNNNDNNNPECNSVSPETHHNSYVTSSNGSHDRRPRGFSIPGQVTSSSRVQLAVSSSSHSPLGSSSSLVQEASSTGEFVIRNHPTKLTSLLLV